MPEMAETRVYQIWGVPRKPQLVEAKLCHNWIVPEMAQTRMCQIWEVPLKPPLVEANNWIVPEMAQLAHWSLYSGQGAF